MDIEIDINFELTKAVSYIKKYYSIIISCGAGLSVSSNLPCYHTEKDNIYNPVLDNIVSLFKIQNQVQLIQDRPYFVFTSNIDSLCECHGNYSFKQCVDNCNSLILKNDETNCVECGKELRENILRYGDKYFNDSRF